MRVSLRALLALSLAASSAFGQVKETVTVSLVEVPVTVLDRSGSPIRGLTAANFEIVDEGKKRPVVAFDAIDFSAPAAANALSPLNPVARRNFLVLFDLSFSSPHSITRAQEAAREFVSKRVLPRDRVAVATVDVMHGFKLLTAFTTDRTMLAQAIDQPTAFRGHDPLQLSNIAPMGEEYVAPLAQQIDQAGAEGAGAARITMMAEAQESFANAAREARRRQDEFNKQKVQKQLDILGSLARTLRTVGGQKFVVLLSEGFDAKFVSGTSDQSSAQAQNERNAQERGEIWKVDNESRFGNSATTKMFHDMARFFRRSDVTMHAIDIRGLRVQHDVNEGTKTSSNEGLVILATSTGGEVFRNTNDLGSNFDKMLRQQEVVYVLGFRAPTDEPGRFHEIKVKLVNVPGGRIVHRSGYYEAGDENESERTLSIAQIIVNDMPQPDLGVTALAAAFPSGGDKAQVPVILDIAGADLMRAADDELLVTDVFIYAFDENGVVRDSLFQRMTLELEKVGARLRGGGMKYYGTLALPPGKYAIRSLVRLPEQGKNGFVRTDVVVPRSDELAATTPIFFDDASRWLMVKGTSHAPEAAYPFAANGEEFVPRAGVTPADAAKTPFAVFVQNASPEELTFDGGPGTSVVAQGRGALGAVAVMRLAAAAPSIDITVKKKGTALETRSRAAFQP